MIKTFRNKGLGHFFYSGSKKGIQAKHADRLGDILDLLNAASDVRDMGFSGSGLHPLKGAKRGFWAVSVSGNWRLIFRFENGNAYDIDYLDYH